MAVHLLQYLGQCLIVWVAECWGERVICPHLHEKFLFCLHLYTRGIRKDVTGRQYLALALEECLFLLELKLAYPGGSLHPHLEAANHLHAQYQMR